MNKSDRRKWPPILKKCYNEPKNFPACFDEVFPRLEREFWCQMNDYMSKLPQDDTYFGMKFNTTYPIFIH